MGLYPAGNRFFSTFYMHPSEAIVYYNLNGGTGDFMPVYDGDVMDLGDRKEAFFILMVPERPLRRYPLSASPETGFRVSSVD